MAKTIETTYRANVEVETNEAVKDLDILNRQLSTSLGDFENLNQAIGETEDALGKLDPVKDAKRFKELSSELRELRDRQEDVQIQSLRFTEALAEQPGIVGAVGGSIEGLRGAFRALAANPIIAVLAAITGAFFALRESLNRSEEGTEALNRISAALSGIMDGLFKIIEPIALAFADLAEKLLTNEKLLNGLATAFATVQGIIVPLATFIKDTLINNFQALIGVAGGLGKTLKGIFTLDLDTIKEGVDQASTAFTDGVKGIVDNGKALGNDFVDEFSGGISERADTIKESITKPYTEAANEISEEEQKRLDELAEKQKQAQQILKDAELSLKSERDAELILREEEYQAELKTLREAGITDLTAFEEQYRQDVLAINQRYDEQERQAEQAERERQEQIRAEQLAKEEEERARIAEQKEADRQEQLLEIQNRLEFEQLEADERIAILKREEELLLQNEELTEAERTKIKKQYARQRESINQQEVDNALQAGQELLAGALSFLGEESKAGKAIAISQSLINTYQAVSKALSAYPPPFSYIAAAGQLAFGLANVRKIRQTETPNVGDSGGSSVSAPRSGGIAASAPTIPSINAPQIVGDIGGVDTGTQVAETIQRASERPTRAYVVDSDIRNSQQLDRRTRTSATF